MPSTTNNTVFVLDSYALLAYFRNEPGSQRIEELLTRAAKGVVTLYMSVVNLGEVIYHVERAAGLNSVKETLSRIIDLNVGIVDADRSLTFEAAHLKAVHPIAYADCFAAALARQRQATLLTGDPEFRKLANEADLLIEWLGSPIKE